MSQYKINNTNIIFERKSSGDVLFFIHSNFDTKKFWVKQGEEIKQYEFNKNFETTLTQEFLDEVLLEARDSLNLEIRGEKLKLAC